MAEPTVGDILPTIDLPTTSEPALEFPLARPSQPRGLPHVPGYEVLEVLGRGGMGIVYQALQTNLKRPVALKMMLAGERATPTQIARFRAEAESVARLAHPNIVHIHDVGDADGHPYLAMEYVPGGTLSRRVGGQPQPAKQAARLVQILAQAIHYAHQNGIVHRDLKPGNVLLAPSVGSRPSGDSNADIEVIKVTSHSGPTLPSASGVLDLSSWTPKISDFGLAKQLGEASGQTHTGDLIGTPSYMAPEQAPGGSRHITPGTDVYALGAILYWCLTGRPPFRGETVLETLEQVRSREPLPPRRLYLRVPLDLETICLKCLQKDPARRYPTAQELAEDLDRFLTGKPIKACRVSHLSRGWRWCRRHPELATWMTVAMIFLLAGSAFSIYFGLKAQVKEKEANARADEARRATDLSERRGYGLEMRLAYEAWKDGDIATVRQHLDEQIPKESSQADLRGFAWYYLYRLCHLDIRTLTGHTASVYALAASPDGALLASAGEDHEIKIWEIATGRQVRALRVDTVRMRSLSFSPDGRSLAAAGPDNQATLWDVDSGRLVRTFEGHASTVVSVAFCGGGRQLASGSHDRTVRLWDLASGHQILRFHHPATIRSIASSPDVGLLASTCLDGTVKVWDLKRGSEVWTNNGPFGDRSGIAFSPDGRRLAVAAGDAVSVLDSATGEERLKLRGHTSQVSAIAFGPDGQRIASTSRDHTTRIWDALTGDPLTILRGHADDVTAVAFVGAEGRLLASASLDGTAKVWDPGLIEGYSTLHGHLTAISPLAKSLDPAGRVRFSADGRWLISAGVDGLIKGWDSRTQTEKWTLRGHRGAVRDVAASRDGRWFASVGEDGTLRIWDAETGQQRLLLTGHIGPVRGVTISPDGLRIATAGMDGSVRIWDAADGGLLRFIPGECQLFAIAFSPDGHLLAAGGEGGALRVWAVVSGKSVRVLPCRDHSVRSVAFSPDGKQLVSGGASSLIHIWSTESGHHLRTLRGHNCPVISLAYSPDGSRLLSTGACDQALQLWDIVTGQQILTLAADASIVHAVFGPDGLQIAGAADDGTVRLWDARAQDPEMRAENEVRGLIKFLSLKGLAEAEMQSRIQTEHGITDDVRHTATKLAGSYAAQLQKQEALRAVQFLFSRPMLREDVLANLRADRALPDVIRAHALELAKQYPEDVMALISLCELIVTTPGADKDQVQHALRLAQAACHLRPEEPESWIAQGMARYRLGDNAAAIAALIHPEEAHLPCPDPLLTVQRLAFLAMAQHRAGRRHDAQRSLEQLRELMNRPFGTGRQRVADSWFREAKSVVGARAV